MSTRVIKNVIFDLGNVLNSCDLDYAIRKISERAHVSIDSIEAFLATDVIDRFDGGQLSVEGFQEELSHATGWSGSLEELRSIWEEMLFMRENVEMIDLMVRLKEQGYQVFILSNINPIHREQAERSFEFMRHAHGIVYSCDVQMIKPDPEIFMHLLEKFDIQAEETIFIDDREANIIAAENLGIRSVLHKTYEETAAAVSALLVL